MKRLLLLAGLLVVMCAVGFAQNAAQNASKPRLAVVEFRTNINNDRVKAGAVTVRNLVENQMISSGRFQMISREDIDKLLENQRIQTSDISSSENIKKLQLENINYIVTGSVDVIDNDYAITVRVLDVSTGQFSHSNSDLMGSSSRDLFDGIQKLMTKFLEGMGSDGDKVVQNRTDITAKIQYSAHVSSIGWTGDNADGAIAGTIGQSRQMEAMRIRAVSNISGGVRYNSYVQSYGWMGWVYDNSIAGTTGQSKRMEAVQIELTGELAKHFDVRYRVHMASYGWSGWYMNGAVAGTTGQSRRIEAIQIMLEKKQ